MRSASPFAQVRLAEPGGAELSLEALRNLVVALEGKLASVRFLAPRFLCAMGRLPDANLWNILLRYRVS